jgi:iron complex outermembrane recepter protein
MTPRHPLFFPAKRFRPKTSCLLSLCIASLSLAAPTFADSTNAPPLLEEVLVTATKREQSVQDIPLSVAAVTGDRLAETSTHNLGDLTALVPNIHFTQTGLSTQMRIRGIGSDNSQGFEQSVGVYVDGIFRGRAQLFRAPFFDMERIEVLRGPQSTLFGKNSIAGALDLITAKPTDELTGSLTASYETAFKTQEITSVVSGPLSDTLLGRIALRMQNDPGYFDNTTKATDEAEQDIQSGRISLSWLASDSVEVQYSGERNEFDVLGRAMEFTQDLPNAAGNSYSSNLNGTIRLINTAVPSLKIPQSQLEANQDYKRQTNSPEFSNNTSTSHKLKAEWDLDGYTITSLTGNVSYDYDENCDCDFTDANIFDLKVYEDYRQLSQEIRIASPLGQKVEWLGGVFFQSYDQHFTDLLRVPRGSILPFIVASSPSFSDTIKPLVISEFANTGILRDFYQSSQSQSIFGQMTWNIADSFRVITGGRLTQESKKGLKQLNTYDFDTNAPYSATASPLVPKIYASDSFKVDTEELAGHNLNKTRDESAFTPLLITQWDINENNSTYFSWTKGFKAGGFDPRSNKPGAFEFEEEKAEALELGYKASQLDGRSEMNVALYRTDYTDLQVSQFDGAVGFNVGNAKKTRVQGLELDGRFAISSHLQALYGVSLLDFEYVDFKNGNCHFGQVGTVDSNGDGSLECDYSGKRGVYTPDYTLNLTLDYRRNLTTELEWSTILDLQQVDGHQVHVNLDPKGEIDPYTLLGLRLQLGAEHWHLALLGKNLLDEDIITFSANAPLSESTFKTNTFYSFLNRPRTVALEAAFRF